MSQNKKEKPKNNKKWFLVFTVLWAAALILWLSYPTKGDSVDSGTFAEKASVNQKVDKVGAKVSLKETIHGTKGVTYRYIIKTDCDKWDFESRYMTETPLDWVTDQTSAVEVLVYDVRVCYNGTAYANDVYYIAPLLDGVCSENLSLDKWKQKLIKKAYQTYASEPQQTVCYRILGMLPIILFAISLVFGLRGLSKVLTHYFEKEIDHYVAEEDEEK